MKKNKKDDIVFKKFTKKYKVVFKNEKFIEFTKNHFNNNGGFAAFIIAFFENQVGEKKAMEHIRINIDAWLSLFYDLYNDKKVILTFNSLSINPIIEFDKIIKMFSNFDSIISTFVNYFHNENINMKMPDEKVESILKTGLGYILYNCIECKLFYDLFKIIIDVEYEQKVIMVLNNTKLFAKAKKEIIDNCGKKINDLITMLLAVSKNLYCDK